MINGRDRRRPGLLPGQRGGRCHRRPDRFQRPFESTSRPHPALDEIAWCCGSAAQPAGLRVGHSFQHPGSISPSACRAPNTSSKLSIVGQFGRAQGRQAILVPYCGQRPSSSRYWPAACSAQSAVVPRPVEPRPAGSTNWPGGDRLESDEEDATPPDLEVNLPRFGLLVRWRDGEIG